MLPIKLLGPTKPFTPKFYLRIIEREDSLLLVDSQIDVPGFDTIGMELRMALDGTTVTQHFRCYIDDQFFSAIEPTMGRNLQDLREVNGIKPTTEYALILRGNVGFYTGMTKPTGIYATAPLMKVTSIAKLKEIIQANRAFGV